MDIKQDLRKENEPKLRKTRPWETLRQADAAESPKNRKTKNTAQLESSSYHNKGGRLLLSSQMAIEMTWII